MYTAFCFIQDGAKRHLTPDVYKQERRACDNFVVFAPQYMQVCGKDFDNLSTSSSQ